MKQIPIENDLAASLHATVNSYLSMLLAVAECLGTACPPVGGPYRHRLTRLERRLAFDSSQEAVADSCAEVARELDDYSSKASEYLRCHRAELRRAVAGLGDIVRVIAQRQDSYASQLCQLADRMDGAARAEGSGTPPDAVISQAAVLKAYVGNMGQESQSLVERMREELAGVEQRLAETEITDPVTGLTNRREMERRIRAAAAEEGPPVLIRFASREPLEDDVARQVGARIGSQFRYNDVVCRWSDREFLVLFRGPMEVARARSEQVVPWVAGRYLLDTGEIANVQVEAGLVDANPMEAALSEAVRSVLDAPSGVLREPAEFPR